METHAGAAAVMHVAEFLQATLRYAAGKGLAIEFAIAGDLYFEHIR